MHGVFKNIRKMDLQIRGMGVFSLYIFLRPLSTVSFDCVREILVFPLIFI